MFAGKGLAHWILVQVLVATVFFVGYLVSIEGTSGECNTLDVCHFEDAFSGDFRWCLGMGMKALWNRKVAQCLHFFILKMDLPSVLDFATRESKQSRSGMRQKRGLPGTKSLWA